MFLLLLVARYKQMFAINGMTNVGLRLTLSFPPNGIRKLRLCGQSEVFIPDKSSVYHFLVSQ